MAALSSISSSSSSRSISQHLKFNEVSNRSPLLNVVPGVQDIVLRFLDVKDFAPIRSLCKEGKTFFTWERWTKQITGYREETARAYLSSPICPSTIKYDNIIDNLALNLKTIELNPNNHSELRLRKYKKLITLKLNDVDSSNEYTKSLLAIFLENISINCPNLEDLDVGAECLVYPRLIDSCPTLRSVKLNMAFFPTEKMVSALNNHPHLSHVSLYITNIGSKSQDCHLLPKINRLKELNVAQVNLDNPAIASIARCISVTSLSILNSHTCTDSGVIAMFSTLSNLEKLTIRFLQKFESSLIDIIATHLPKIHYLNLIQMHSEERPVELRDFTTDTFRKFKNLREFDLLDQRLSDIELLSILANPNLRRLTLRIKDWTRLTKSNLESMPQNFQITQIRLTSMKTIQDSPIGLSIDSIPKIALKFPNLCHFDLSFLVINKAQAEFIEKCLRRAGFRGDISLPNFPKEKRPIVSLLLSRKGIY